jgi:hypothetical protein
MPLGSGELDDRPSRMLPSALRKSRSRFGVRAGPYALDVGGRRRTWSYAFAPRWNSSRPLVFGDSKAREKPLSVKPCDQSRSI